MFRGERLADEKPVALKCIKQDNDNKGFPVTAIREMRILRQMRHKVTRPSRLDSLAYHRLICCLQSMMWRLRSAARFITGDAVGRRLVDLRVILRISKSRPAVIEAGILWWDNSNAQGVKDFVSWMGTAPPTCSISRIRSWPLSGCSM